MPTIDFLLALHNHQPVGNFDDVFEACYQNAYRPFLDLLSRHPAIRLALHHSGSLLDWLSVHRPEYLDALGTLAARGQVELLTGGYYEPILPAIPEADREGQIRKLSTWIESRYGVKPAGLWLTERVWEPGLVGSLARAGVRYTMTDDSHFLAAGLAPEDLWGPYVTEDQGDALTIFPISKELRYLIPFRPPEDTIAFLRGLSAVPGRMALLGDDGEKFGVWPRTHALVYDEGWLVRFFTLLEENASWIRLRTPTELLTAPPRGRIYLPTASYEEMMEWALPAESQSRYHEFRRHVESERDGDARFVRGGLWRNFLVRYPESNHMQKRMLQVRRRAEGVRDASPAAYDAARDLLWAAQCNCAYWHGVFGGLYLPHLRNAVYEKILEAEGVLDAAEHGSADFSEARREDLDADGHLEVILANRDLTLVLSPALGGAMEELSVKPLRLALMNGLSRRLEAYHERVAGARNQDEGTASIHDLVAAKESGLERHLAVDAYRRLSLVDHFLRDDATREEWEEGRAGELGEFLSLPYESAVAARESGKIASLRRTGIVWREGRERRVAVEKRVSVGERGARIEVAYAIAGLEAAPLPVWFGVEWNLALLAGDSPDHRYRIPRAGGEDEDAPLASRGETTEATRVTLLDRHRGFRCDLRWSRPALLWRAPVETVSLSEAGFERIYQSSSLLPTWRFTLEPERPVLLDFTLEVVPL